MTCRHGHLDGARLLRKENDTYQPLLAFQRSDGKLRQLSFAVKTVARATDEKIYYCQVHTVKMRVLSVSMRWDCRLVVRAGNLTSRAMYKLIKTENRKPS